MAQTCSATSSLSVFLCDIRKPCICASPGVWHCLEVWEESAEGGAGGSSFSAAVWVCGVVPPAWIIFSITSSEWKMTMHAALPHSGMPSGCAVVWCVFSHAHTCMCVFSHTCVLTGIHVHMCALTYECALTCIHVHRFGRSHAYVCVACALTHIHVHRCMYACFISTSTTDTVV